MRSARLVGDEKGSPLAHPALHHPQHVRFHYSDLFDPNPSSPWFLQRVHSRTNPAHCARDSLPRYLGSLSVTSSTSRPWLPPLPQRATDICDSGKVPPPPLAPAVSVTSFPPVPGRVDPRFDCRALRPTRSLAFRLKANTVVWLSETTNFVVHLVGAQVLLARSRVQELPSARIDTDWSPNHEQCASFRTPQSVTRTIYGGAI